MFKIDVFVSKGRPFDRQAVERARPQAIDEAQDAPCFLVASPEDTVLAKLEWFRLGGETSERQWWDVVGILKVTEDADRTYLRGWAAEQKPRRRECEFGAGGERDNHLEVNAGYRHGLRAG